MYNTYDDVFTMVVPTTPSQRTNVQRFMPLNNILYHGPISQTNYNPSCAVWI